MTSNFLDQVFYYENLFDSSWIIFLGGLVVVAFVPYCGTAIRSLIEFLFDLQKSLEDRKRIDIPQSTDRQWPLQHSEEINRTFSRSRPSSRRSEIFEKSSMTGSEQSKTYFQLLKTENLKTKSSHRRKRGKRRKKLTK